MSYGNWCGPNWSAGQNKAAKDLHGKDFKVKALNKQDQACKNHDINIRFAKNDLDIKNANEQFYRESGYMMGSMVAIGGPTHSHLANPHSSKRVVMSKRNTRYSPYTPIMREGPRRVPVEDIEPYDDDTTMEYDGDDGDPPQIPRRGGGTGGGTTSNGQLRETQISRGIPPSYQLQDTHTTVLPFVYGFSMCGLRNDGALRLSLNMTDIMNPLNFTPSLVEPTPSTTITRGFFKAGVVDNVNWPASLGRILGISGETPKVSGHEWWNKIYEYYTVLESHYTLTIMPMCFESSGITGFTVGEYEESYSTALANGRMPTLEHVRARHNEGIKWDYKIGAIVGDNNNKRHVFTGSYKPGQAETNVRNDTDVKTWNLVSASPILTEGHNFLFYRLPEVSDFHVDYLFRYNCTIEIKFVVQYKDRISAFKFPGDDTSSALLSNNYFYAYN